MAETVAETEEALMAAYCAGDHAAFVALYARIGPKLHGFFMRSFNNRTVADDLLQTTLLKLHRAREQFRPEVPLRPWLFSIAARVRIDEYRKQGRSVERLDDEMVDAAADQGAPVEPPPDAAHHTNECVHRVRAALAALPESQRVIIHLHRFEGLTFNEIAIAMGASEGAIKLRAFRGYQRLRKTLRPLLTSRGES